MKPDERLFYTTKVVGSLTNLQWIASSLTNPTTTSSNGG
jgi:hypothetical protein